jgi:hypothetical protein
VDVIQPLLNAAGVDMLRYGGGSCADYDQLNAVARQHLDDEEQKIIPLAAASVRGRDLPA